MLESINYVSTVLINQWFAITFCGLIFLLYLYKNSKKYDYWRKQGVVGPTPIPVFGNSLSGFIQPMNKVEEQRYKKYGKVYGFYDMATPILCVAEPELVKLVSVKDAYSFINRRPNASVDEISAKSILNLRGDDWKRVRSILSPTFTSGKIKRMLKTIEDSSANILQILESKAATKEDVNVKHLYGSFTMDVIARCAFATKTNTYNNPNDPFVKNANEIFNVRYWRLIVTMIVPKFIRKFFDFNLTPPEIRYFFRQTIKHLINQRKENNVKLNDFLQLLLDAEQNSSSLADEIKDINEGHVNNETKEEIENNAKMLSGEKPSLKKLTENEIIAQSMLFFIAGYETTASLLTYCSYCLALNPETQEILYREIKAYLDQKGEFDYEMINTLPYLNAVINEALRLYPPVLAIQREATQDYKLPYNGIKILKGNRVHLPIYAMHHDPEYFPEPEKFKPERFLPENIINSIKPYTYLPFGAGPRNCIGMRFALVEAKLALCKVVNSFKFIRSENTDVPLKLKRLTLLFPAKRVVLKVEKRK